jgi:hypothetical protein
MPRKLPDYHEKIERLRERKEFLFDRIEKMKKELNQIHNRLKTYERRITKKDIEETIVISNKLGISIKDIKKLMTTVDAENIKALLEKSNKPEGE